MTSFGLQNLLNELNRHQQEFNPMLTIFLHGVYVFLSYIVFSNWFKLKTIRNYFGINFFDLFYTNMIMKKM